MQNYYQHNDNNKNFRVIFDHELNMNLKKKKKKIKRKSAWPWQVLIELEHVRTVT